MQKPVNHGVERMMFKATDTAHSRTYQNLITKIHHWTWQCWDISIHIRSSQFIFPIIHLSFIFSFTFRYPKWTFPHQTSLCIPCLLILTHSSCFYFTNLTIAEMYNNISFIAVIYTPDGKRPLGRPGYRWEDNIRMDLREIEWEGVGWNHVAQDWNLWKALVNPVMNLRVA